MDKARPGGFADLGIDLLQVPEKIPAEHSKMLQYQVVCVCIEMDLMGKELFGHRISQVLLTFKTGNIQSHLLTTFILSLQGLACRL